MAEFKPLEFKALIFDVYSTLIDWETGVYQGIRPLLERINPTLAENKKSALFAYFEVEDELQLKFPSMLYRDILTRAHAELAVRAACGSADTTAAASGDLDEHTSFGKSIPAWKPFPDTIPALAYLSTKFKLFVLSNVDRESFGGTRAVLETSLPDHQFTFDAVYTAQDIGSYKPNVANFEYALRKLKEDFGIEKDQVIVTAASLSHDHVPANKLGLASVFIDRNAVSLNEDKKIATFDAVFPTLGSFAEEVKRQAGDV